MDYQNNYIPAVIYARYSSGSQREESIEGQLRECHAYAKHNGFTVIGEYVDKALTGRTDKRRNKRNRRPPFRQLQSRLPRSRPSARQKLPRRSCSQNTPTRLLPVQTPLSPFRAHRTRNMTFPSIIPAAHQMPQDWRIRRPTPTAL